jgi:hypothetical protein
MSRIKSPLLISFVAILLTAGVSALGPRENSLGSGVHVVYLHASWALTADLALGFAALTGLLALIIRRDDLHRWSAALGYSGLFFWITFIPLSFWAMQDNWNGLFLSEPRLRVSVAFAVTGILLQVGLALFARPMLTSLFNFLYFVALRIVLTQTAYILHPPPSPIFNSGIPSLEIYFIVVILLNLTAAYFMTRWWLQRLHKHAD